MNQSTTTRRREAATGRSIAFVTGKLAEPALQQVVGELAARMGFQPHVIVTKISVAALLTVDWLIGKIQIPPEVQLVVLPGWCRGDTAKLSDSLGGVAVERGPKDLRDLPRYFEQEPDDRPYGSYDIEILAEINHANRLSLEALVEEAIRLRQDGADIIDLGGTPGEDWPDLRQAVEELTRQQFRVSIDSFDPREVEQAVAGGAELVLSVNETNRDLARHWGVDVVALPDRWRDEGWLQSLEKTVEVLESQNVPFRLDPILEPIGFGFAASLHRYFLTRQHFPQAKMLMGIGNLTELTEVDSAGVNALLIGFCQELGIQSVLTTQVINWARTSVREINVARQLMKYAVAEHSLPKHRDPRLVMLRDEKLNEYSSEELKQLQSNIRDRSFRLFASEGKLTALNGEVFVQKTDPFELFVELGVRDPSHAFYLGWELMKATLALQLGKQYVQDEPLDWGLLTVPEGSHLAAQERHARTTNDSRRDSDDGG